MLFFSALGFLFGDFLALHGSKPLITGVILLLVFGLAYRFRILKVLTAFSILGFLLAEWALWRYHPPAFLFPLENKTTTLKGEVVGIPDLSERVLRFDWKVQGVLIRVSWKNPSILVESGDQLAALVRIRKPPAYVNPTKDERRLWVSQGIVAVAEVKGSVERQGHRLTLDGVREWLHKKAQYYAGDLPYLGVIEALVLGVSRGISPADRALFQSTGTSHLMAISGLHIALVAGFISLLLKVLLRWRSYRWTQQPTHLLALLGGGVGAAIYAALAGFSLPTQRALIMIGVVILMVWRRREVSISSGLSLAVLMVLCFDPMAILNPGFWLSCTAVAWLLYSRGQSWWHVQAALLLGLAPFTLWYFHSTSLISPLTNALAIPWASFLVVPLSLIAFLLLPFFPTVAVKVMSLADALIGMGMQFLALCAQVPLATWHATPSFWATVLAFLGAAWLLMPRGTPFRWMGVFLWLPLLFPLGQSLKPGEFKAVVFDVGQGLAVYVQTENHHLLYDVGPTMGMKQSAGDRVIAPFLQAHRIQALDAVVISHFDADHAGGLKAITEHFPIYQRWSSDMTQPFGGAYCQKGVSWEWDRVRFEFLHPAEGKIEKKRNNQSCVLKVSYGEHQLLLTGDIESPVEKRLLESDIQAEVLLVPHHGSLSSSTEYFIRAVDPEWAIVTAGRYNRYRHPREAVLERYEVMGIPVLNTIDQGAIELHFVPHKRVQIQNYAEKGNLEKVWYDWTSSL